jgi:hypothetical protein
MVNLRYTTNLIFIWLVKFTISKILKVSSGSNQGWASTSQNGDFSKKHMGILQDLSKKHIVFFSPTRQETKNMRFVLIAET